MSQDRQYARMTKDEAEKVFAAAVKAEEAGDNDQAFKLYEQAWTLDPAAVHAGLRWARLHFQEENWHEAIRIAREVSKSRPRLRLALRLIGMSYAELSQWQTAERFYRRTLAIKDDAITWVLLAHVLDRQRKYGQVVDCLRQALNADPDYEEAHYNLGRVYRLKGRLKLAEMHLRLAIDLDSKYGLAYGELGQLLLQQKDRTKEAVSLLERALVYKPDDRWSRAYLANALWSLRKLKAAKEQFLSLIELSPDDAMPYRLYGEFLLHESRDPSVAEMYLRKAAEIGSSNLADW